MGTSETLRNNGNKVEDHPHACGDKFSDCQHSNTAPGSSPRVWGQGVGGYMRVVNYRIIPTRVGTRVYERNITTAGQDHPHACGDKNFAEVSRSPRKGSSPRVWGQELFPVLVFPSLGIIPTRVGTSPDKQIICRFAQDHPHACGDKV